MAPMPSPRAAIPRTDNKTGTRKGREAEGTGGSDQPGCREIPPRVKKGVLGEGDSETGTESRCADSGLRDQTDKR